MHGTYRDDDDDSILFPDYSLMRTITVDQKGSRTYTGIHAVRRNCNTSTKAARWNMRSRATHDWHTMTVRPFKLL